MPSFSEEEIRKVREANDLVELFSERTTLRQRGRDFWCCCPFHQEKTPSCKIDPSTQTWHCFGCGEGGDVISYIRKLDDVDFVDALRFLARRANIELTESPQAVRSHSKKARLKEVCQETAQYYHMLLMRSGDDAAQNAREYLSGRNLGGDIPRNWMLGFAPGRNRLVSHLSSLGYSAEEMIEANVALRAQNGLRDRFFDRVMFPIADIRGEVIAFGGRILGSGEPKYLNTGDTPIFHKSEVLYGLDKAKASMASSGDAIICEGYTDVIALHEAHFTNAVATLGTSLTRQHIRILSHHAKSRIIYLFDGDEAGQRAAERALGFIDASVTPEAGVARVDLFAVTLPGGLDPADFLAQEGAEKLNQLLAHAVPLIKYGIDRKLSKFDLSHPEGRGKATVAALSVLAPIKDSLLAKDYAVYIASKVRAREQDVLHQLGALKASVNREEGSSFDSRAKALQPKHVLSSVEKNRLRSEREFLSLCAQNPAMVSEFMSVLGQTNWHEKAHKSLADALMDIMASGISPTVAEVISRAQTLCPYAEKVLTSSVTQGVTSAHSSLTFLADELAIGDLEEAILGMKEHLSTLDASSSEEKDFLFQSIVALQNEVNQLRARHT